MRKLASILMALAFAGIQYGPPAAADSGVRETVASPVIVIGFLGGHVRHDNIIHTEVQLASRLRSMYPSGVHVEAFENQRETEAYDEILRLLDIDRDGSLTDTEKRTARIILYGHSWGASEIVTLARQLQKNSIPVLLTIQVDSISRHHENDGVIPPNVAEAVNFYQPHGILHGRPEIRAADPHHTKILGNFRFDYSENPVRCDGKYPWWQRSFVSKGHIEIECDPSVWGQVENLIRSKLPPADWEVNTLPTPALSPLAIASPPAE